VYVLVVAAGGNVGFGVGWIGVAVGPRGVEVGMKGFGRVGSPLGTTTTVAVT
jgi:hypothetical protein